MYLSLNADKIHATEEQVEKLQENICSTFGKFAERISTFELNGTREENSLFFREL